MWRFNDLGGFGKTLTYSFHSLLETFRVAQFAFDYFAETSLFNTTINRNRNVKNLQTQERYGAASPIALPD